MKNEALTILEEMTGMSLNEMMKAGDTELDNINDEFMEACNELGNVCELEEKMPEHLRDYVSIQVYELKLALRSKAIEAMDKYYNIK